MTSVPDARLRGSVSQRVFDVLLRTLAEPGSIRMLPDEVRGRAIDEPLWLALALADVDVTVSVGGEGGTEAEQLVHDATGARIAPVPDADIVVMPTGQGSYLDEVRVGTPLAPEQGARVAIGAAGLKSISSIPSALDSRCVAVTVSGPGVPGTRTIGVAGVRPEVFARLGTASGTFPTGFDAWIFAPGGRVVAIPRSAIVEIERG